MKFKSLIKSLAIACIVALSLGVVGCDQPKDGPKADPPTTTDAKGGDAKPADTKAGDAKPADDKAGDTKAGDTKAGDAAPADGKEGAAKDGTPDSQPAADEKK